MYVFKMSFRSSFPGLIYWSENRNQLAARLFFLYGVQCEEPSAEVCLLTVMW